MVDDRRSRAILIYLSRGRSPFPRSDPDAVIREFPADSSELLAYAEAVLHEMKALPTDWATETYHDAIERVRNEMARRHPELSKEAVDAIGWVFSYNWK